MNVVLDIGNSFIKAGGFQNGKLVNTTVLKEEKDVVSHIRRLRPQHVIMSSVRKEMEALEREIGQEFLLLKLTPVLSIPIKNKYQNPDTLGTDRLAAAVGAFTLFPGRNCLSIDIGTCITFDFVNEHGEYLGGSISPGISMKLKALHTFASRLPLIEAVGETTLIGNNTRESILNGVINGTQAEIEGIIQQYSNFFSSIMVIICGGDAKFFESRIKAPIFVVPELVLIGLNRILEHNVQA